MVVFCNEKSIAIAVNVLIIVFLHVIKLVGYVRDYSDSALGLEGLESAHWQPLGLPFDNFFEQHCCPDFTEQQ